MATTMSHLAERRMTMRQDGRERRVLRVPSPAAWKPAGALLPRSWAREAACPLGRKAACTRPYSGLAVGR
jgi:hypothetical protein